MKFSRPVVKPSLIAHILAWMSFLFVAFWPSFYQGTQATPVGPDGSGGEVVHMSASVIEANGRWVLVPLLAPVALTGAGLIVALLDDKRTFTGKFLMWTFAILLVVFCGLALASIGMFYLPAALALLVAAIAMSIRNKSAPTAGQSAGAGG